jgi:Leucine-rich repeat (LRR) protein
LFKRLSRRGTCSQLQRLDLGFNFIAAITDTVSTAPLGSQRNPFSHGSSSGGGGVGGGGGGGGNGNEVVSRLRSGSSSGGGGGNGGGRGRRRGLKKLHTLSLRSNRISTLAGLDEVGLPVLQRLDLADNVISDLRELGVLAAALPQLLALHLHGNPVQFMEGYRSLALAVMAESKRAYAQ